MKKILLGLVIAVAALLLLRNVVAKMAIDHGVKAVTGVGVDVGSIDLGLFSTHVGVKNLRVLNPKGFSEPTMVSLPELYVDYDLGAFLKGVVHLEEVRLNLAELVVIKNAQGAVNVTSLKPMQTAQKGEAPPAEKPKPGKAPKLQIDELQLKVGRVIYKDYSKGAPTEQSFDVNLDERFQNITNPQLLGGLIISKALAKTTIAQLANLDLGALRSNVEMQLKGAATQLEGQATKLLGSTLGSQGTSAVKSLFSGSKERGDAR